jgi:hypothetical protein
LGEAGVKHHGTSAQFYKTLLLLTVQVIYAAQDVGVHEI